VVKLTNGIRKNGDTGLYCDDSNGFTPGFPGIVVETGFSNVLHKSRQLGTEIHTALLISCRLKWELSVKSD
jgi:hypothetical protein